VTNQKYEHGCRLKVKIYILSYGYFSGTVALVVRHMKLVAVKDN
jgi:hypothetical protein